MIEIYGSSLVQAYDYDAMTEILTLKLNGSIFRYFEVPQDVVDKFIASESAGKFFMAHIKPRFKHFEKVKAE